MRPKKQLRALLFGVLISVLAMSGCGMNGGTEETGAAADGRLYTIYTLDLSTGIMGSYTYASDTADAEALMNELLDQLGSAPSSSGEAPVLSADTTGIPEARLLNNVLFLDMPESYASLEPAREIVVRAAIVETMTQADDIDFVCITVAGELLTDADGEAVGFMESSDFISDVTARDELNTQTVTLFFADPSLSYLVETETEVSYAAHTSVETAVMRALAEGPAYDTDARATLPSSLHIISVQMHDGTCYVNLSSEFEEDALDMNAWLPVYSIVDSLTRLDGVEYVQLMIEGNSLVSFRNTADLDHPFSEDLRYTQPGWDD